MGKRRMGARLNPSQINNKVGKSRVGQKGTLPFPFLKRDVMCTEHYRLSGNYSSDLGFICLPQSFQTLHFLGAI